MTMCLLNFNFTNSIFLEACRSSEPENVDVNLKKKCLLTFAFYSEYRFVIKKKKEREIEHAQLEKKIHLLDNI